MPRHLDAATFANELHDELATGEHTRYELQPADTKLPAKMDEKHPLNELGPSRYAHFERRATEEATEGVAPIDKTISILYKVTTDTTVGAPGSNCKRPAKGDKWILDEPLETIICTPIGGFGDFGNDLGIILLQLCSRNDTVMQIRNWLDQMGPIKAMIAFLLQERKREQTIGDASLGHLELAAQVIGWTLRDRSAEQMVRDVEAFVESTIELRDYSPQSSVLAEANATFYRGVSHIRNIRNFLRSVGATANDNLSTLIGYVQGYLNEEVAAEAQQGNSPDNAIALVAGRPDPTEPLTTLLQKQDDILEAIKALTLAIDKGNAATTPKRCNTCATEGCTRKCSNPKHKYCSTCYTKFKNEDES